MSKIKGFFPYLFVVFFNSFIDLGHKILIQDTLYQTTSGHEYTIFSSIVNALILIPYILMFTPSGFISDRFAKVKVLRITAALAIPITLLITLCYYKGYFWCAFSLTFLLAIQSTFNSPAKYGFIKELFGKENIAQGNAFVQTTTIIAILAGTFVFSILFSHYVSANLITSHASKSAVLMAFAPVGFILVLLSCGETFCTFILPKKPAASPDSHYDIKRYVTGKYLKTYLTEIKKSHLILICIIGLSLFWAINQVLLASYGAYLKEYVGNVGVVFAQGSLAIGGIGVLLGAMYAGKVSKGFIETGIIPIGAIGVTIGLLFLPHLSSEFFIALLFLIYGFFGGLLVVPLNALIQFNAKNENLGKVLAGNNFFQNVFMLLFLVGTVVMTLFHADSIITLYTLFFIALAATIYSFVALPQSFIRFLVYFVVSRFYRIDVDGLNNIPSTGGVLLLGNHASFLDWAMIQIASPRPIRFVMERSIYEKPYLKWILAKFKIIPISSRGSKRSIETIKEALNAGDVVALFPEGYMSRNGQIGAFRSGFERAVSDTSAVIVPFYLRGMWGTKSSYATKQYKINSRLRMRSIGVSFGEAMPATSTAAQVKQRVTEISIHAWKTYTESLNSIQEEWLSRAKRLGSALCVADSLGIKLSYRRLIAIVMQMKNEFADTIKGQKNVGIILPTSVGGVVTNLALLCLGKTLVNLNYTSGLKAIEHAIQEAEIKTIFTSRKFINKLSAKGFDLESLLEGRTVCYLEDYKKPSTKAKVAKNLITIRLLPLWVLKRLVLTRCSVNDTAAILFSSGSEGKPKGVELTHRNILGNVKQISSVFNIKESDVILSSLPLFHAFGLTVTTIMPLVEGVPFACHPDPTDAAAIGKLVYRYKATVMCGTSTFLGLYCRNRKLQPLMFQSLRLVIAGAEKLSANVQQAFKDKFNITIYEGYGTTEVAPVASSNLPDILNPNDWHLHVANKPGTVGLALPGSAFRIVDPDTLEPLASGEEGLILVGGTQVMRGYLNNPEKTRDVLIEDGDITWYKTGDKGRLDEDGFLTIVDRYSRFAKVGGEMISLGAVEQKIIKAINDDDIDILAVAIPDDKKGEKIILLYSMDIEAKVLRDMLIDAKVENIMLPAEFIRMDELPKLGSGKKDFASAKKMVLELLQKDD